MLLEQLDRRIASRALCTAGNRIPTRIPMIAITTNISTRVKPRAIEFFGSPLLANFELTNITVSVRKDIENEEI